MANIPKTVITIALASYAGMLVAQSKGCPDPIYFAYKEELLESLRQAYDEAIRLDTVVLDTVVMDTNQLAVATQPKNQIIKNTSCMGIWDDSQALLTVEKNGDLLTANYGPMIIGGKSETLVLSFNENTKWLSIKVGGHKKKNSLGYGNRTLALLPYDVFIHIMQKLHESYPDAAKHLISCRFPE